MRPRFLGPYQVELTGKKRQGRALWRLVRQLDLDCDINGERRIFSAPQGFPTDFASVPRFFWRLIPPGGLYAGAAAIHDFLYKNRIRERELGKKAARKEADLALLEGMKAAGVAKWRRGAMFRGVRTFGGRGWGS